MKNRFLLGMLVMALVLGMVVISCDDGSKGGSSSNDGSLDGTWTYQRDSLLGITWTLEITGSTYTLDTSSGNKQKGNISYDKSTMTTKQTHIWNKTSSTWESAGNTGKIKYTYSLSGNILTRTEDKGSPETWTKK